MIDKDFKAEYMNENLICLTWKYPSSDYDFIKKYTLLPEANFYFNRTRKVKLKFRSQKWLQKTVDEWELQMADVFNEDHKFLQNMLEIVQNFDNHQFKKHFNN